MVLGRIFCEEVVGHDKVDYIKYIEDGEYSSEDVPTLFVGWKEIKENWEKHMKDWETVAPLLPYTHNVYKPDILNKKIEENKYYWEFSYEENRQKHVSGVNDFVKNVPDMYFSRFNYINIDPVFLNIKTTEELINYLDLRESENDTYFYENRSIYILKNDKDILGLHLPLIRYLKFDIKQLKNYINEYSSITVNDSGEFLSAYKLKLPNYPKINRYMAHLLVL